MMHIAYYNEQGVIERVETHSNDVEFTDGLVVANPSVLDNYIVVNGDLVPIPNLKHLNLTTV